LSPRSSATTIPSGVQNGAQSLKVLSLRLACCSRKSQEHGQYKKCCDCHRVITWALFNLSHLDALYPSNRCDFTVCASEHTPATAACYQSCSQSSLQQQFAQDDHSTERVPACCVARARRCWQHRKRRPYQLPQARRSRHPNPQVQHLHHGPRWNWKHGAQRPRAS